MRKSIVQVGLWMGVHGALSAGATEQPNILLILSDDIGFADIGCYGGEAETPVLDRLAHEGIRFTQFYNVARCMPTRASLLTGLYPHQAGIGHMGANWGVPSYTGTLNDQCVTLAEVLQGAGYHTSHLGKWHVGFRGRGHLPHLRGFDRSWTRMERVHYFRSDIYWKDGRPWECPDPENFYATEEMDRQAIPFIHEAIEQGKPFFMYAAYDAAHWPLHAWPEDIAKYRGRFTDRGWDVMRREWYERQIEMGLIDPAWALSRSDPSIPPWDEVEDKELWDLRLAIYFAQIDSMDRSIGRILAELERLGIADNTLVIYMSDNGACAEGIGSQQTIEPGGPDSFQAYYKPWANLSNTPFRQYKHFLGEGGIATAMIAWWPEGIQLPGGSIIHEPGHVIDIMPTLVEIAGAEYPDRFRGNDILLMEGVSLNPIFQTGSMPEREWLFWEHEGNRAVRKSRWKLLSRYKYDFEFYERWGFPIAPRESEWELYDMVNDRTELQDVADQHPEIVEELKTAFQEWAERVGVLPFEEISGRTAEDVGQN